MKKILSLLLVFVLIFSVVACSKPEVNKPVDKKTETKEGKIDYDKEIVLGAPRDLSPGEKDAYYCSIILQVWEPLVKLENGKIKPILAESWKMSEDGKEWNIKLRKGVKFHDGSDFNADAVIANIDRMKKHSPIKSPFYTMKFEKTYPNLKEFKKVNDYEVKLVFDVPSPTAIERLINFGSPMASPKCFNEDGSFNGFVIGTGPYKITKHVPNQYTTLKAFDKYHGEKAKSKNVKVVAMPSPETRVAALKSGEIVGVLDIGAIWPSQAVELIKDKNFISESTPSTISHFMQFNNSKEGLNNPKLVEAINLAIDRNLIVKELYHGYAVPSANPLNASEPGFIKDNPKADLEKAKKLAKEVLGDKRVKYTLLIPQYGVNRYPYKEQGEYIQSVLKQIGVDVNIKIVEGSEIKKVRKSGDFDLLFHTQGMPNADPVTMLNVFMGSKNTGKYKNEEAVKLLKTASEELDKNKRMDYYKQLQELALKTHPTFPLFHDTYLVVHNKHLKDYKSENYGVTLSKMYWQK